MVKTYTMDLAGRTLKVEIGKVGKQANGCAFVQYGDTTLLCTATEAKAPRDGVDFFPLNIEYSEKFYSIGKFPGGFNKREAKPSENAILTDRMIDRPMRPLFPKDMRNDVTVENMVMAVDPACRPELVAMIGSSIAVAISDIPWDGPCASTQIGLVDGQMIINPSQEQWDNGDMKLTVASTAEKVIMIEAGAKEV
ncbi:MAG: polyribonucleotide nucleotidyltransferase, partial [Lachnospiraceae bacterium]|nr:polyribonucleotide nucleotidyltransferase [Lachnospiraceae bacterium]